MTEKTESNQQIHDNLQTGLKDGELRLHNKFHPTRWKCGYAKYHFHRKFEYEILEKGLYSTMNSGKSRQQPESVKIVHPQTIAR